MCLGRVKLLRLIALRQMNRIDGRQANCREENKRRRRREKHEL
jgi:hypothetical protein